MEMRHMLMFLYFIQSSKIYTIHQFQKPRARERLQQLPEKKKRELKHINKTLKIY